VLFTTIILNLVLGLFTIKACDWVTAHHFGLINWLHLPIWVVIIVGLLFGDLFGQYIPHFIMHKVKWLWKFHMVHHSDTHVDVTTGTRHHPGEWLFREFFMIIGVFVIGIPVWVYFLYRAAAALFTTILIMQMCGCLSGLINPSAGYLFHPTCIRHTITISVPLTDTNYSNNFSLWDRLFGTFVYEDPNNLRYGLDVLDDSTDENLGYQLKIPFDKTIKTDY
jgi:sterol desaturase/sphingolipid hydroxylase (fatty acid hydroxylase superfamily)